MNHEGEIVTFLDIDTTTPDDAHCLSDVSASKRSSHNFLYHSQHISDGVIELRPWANDGHVVRVSSAFERSISLVDTTYDVMYS